MAENLFLALAVPVTAAAIFWAARKYGPWGW